MTTHRFLYIWLPRLATDRYIRKPPPDLDADLIRQPFAVTEAAGGVVRLLGINRPGLQARLHSGMPLADARAILPSLVTLPARRDQDRAVLQTLSRWADRYSPWVAVERRTTDIPDYGDGGLWLNITGCAHLFGGEAGMADAIHRQVTSMGYDTGRGLGGRALSHRRGASAARRDPGRGRGFSRTGPAPFG